jgi:zinc and cadmium transporter
MVFLPFIAAFLVMLVSLIGVVFVWNSAGEWLKKNMRYLVTFSAGVFIIVSYSLFTESLELSNNFVLVIFGVLLGAGLLEVVTRLIPDTHHHHGTEDDHGHSGIDARRVLLGDAVHNVIDGILLVPAFLIDIRFGIVTTLAILLHEAVQEISEFFVLRQAGYSTSHALTMSFIVSSTILVGAVFGTFVSTATALIPALISFAAGAFLYVVFRDLLPSTMRTIVKNGNAGTHLIAGVLGILVMFGMNIFVPEPDAGTTTEEPAVEAAL